MFTIAVLASALLAPPATAGTQSQWTTTPTLWDSGTYDYDGAGNIAGIGGDVYRYDHVGRLMLATADTTIANEQSFKYDRYGNLLFIRTTTAQETTLHGLAVDPATNRLGLACSGTVDGCFTGFYDAATGNQLGRLGTSEYVWDSLGLLAELNTSRRERYIYDANDERILVVDEVANSERYTLRGSANRVARSLSRTRANNVWKLDKDYVYRGGTLIASFSGAGTAPDRHYHVDHLGSTRLVTDGSGFRLAIHTYWPFGPEAAGSETDTERLKFTGHERDSSPATTPGSDLDYMHARYYDANAGRFLTIDPAAGKPARPQTWNRYTYVTNRPINAFDPDGRYLVDFHHDATLILALAAGMWPEQARSYAFWTQEIDDNPATQPINTVPVQRDYHFVSDARLEELRGNSWSGNPRQVGTFLHALQDSYSHAGYSAGLGHYWPAATGFLFGGVDGARAGYQDGHAVDVTGNRPGVAMQAAFATYSYLAALAKRQDGRPAVSFSSIESALLGFFENSDNPTKRKFYYDWLCKRVGCTEETRARTIRE